MGNNLNLKVGDLVKIASTDEFFVSPMEDYIKQIGEISRIKYYDGKQVFTVKFSDNDHWDYLESSILLVRTKKKRIG